jgi:hypothetical protein
MRCPQNASRRTAAGATGAPEAVVATSTQGDSRGSALRGAQALLALLVVAVSGGLAGCGGSDPLEVAVARIVRPDGRNRVPAPPEISAAERLGLQSQARQEGGKPRYQGQVPSDWTPIPVREGQMRDASYQVPGASPTAAPAEVSVLVDRPSPVLANVNRWRRQMGQPPIAAGDLETLAVPVGDQKGYLVDETGTFSGMGGGALEGQRFLALVLLAKDHTLSVRLLGDKATVDAQADAFRAYLKSLRLVQAAPHAAGGGVHTHGGLKWMLPEGWVEEPSKGGPRVMSFRVPSVPAPGLDIALMRFPDTAGGLEPTLAMWAGNAGRPPLDKKEVAALDRFPLLGKEAVFVDMRGAKVLEAGKDPEPTMLLACLVYLDDGVIVSRVWAREADLEPQREAFLAFCKSWRFADDGEEAPK